MVEKSSRGIPKPPPSFFPGEEITLTEPEDWLANRTPALPSEIPNLTAPEEPRDHIIASQPTIDGKVSIVTKPLTNVKKRKGLSKVPQPGQINSGI